MKTSLLASTAIRSLSPIEAMMGRPMRGPDHPAPAPAPADVPASLDSAPIVIEEAQGAEADAPNPAVPPVIASTDDAYEAEFGNIKFDDSGDAVAPDKAEDAEPAAEPKGEAEAEGAAPKQLDSEKTPAELAADQRVADAEARAAAARQEADELRAKLTPKPPVADDKQAPTPEDTRPDPEKYEFGEADSQYIIDLGRWSADQRFDERMAERDARQAEDADFAEMEATWTGAVAQPEIAEQYPDFNDKVVAGADKGEWACSPVMTVTIKSSPVGPHMAYELANNAAESERIASLPPMEQVRELGRIEGKYIYQASQREAAPEAGKPAPKPVSVSKAPAPPENRARGSGGKFTAELDSTYDRMLKEF